MYSSFRGIKLTLEIQELIGQQAPFQDFKDKLYKDEVIVAKVKAIKAEVSEFASVFPLPGLADI